MELTGETSIAAPREKVWDALNDPDVLARCIDGVESLTRESDTRFSGRLAASVGPVKAKFSGAVNLSELDPPHRYVLSGEGKGGVAGFVKGSAEVILSELADGGTHLRYVAKSQVGGKLAQLGARLIEGTAKGYAERFFAALKAEVESPAPAPEEPQVTPEPTPAGLPPMVWLGVLVAAVILLLFFLMR